MTGTKAEHLWRWFSEWMLQYIACQANSVVHTLHDSGEQMLRLILLVSLYMLRQRTGNCSSYKFIVNISVMVEMDVERAIKSKMAVFSMINFVFTNAACKRMLYTP